MRWLWWSLALVVSCLPYVGQGREESVGWFAYAPLCGGYEVYLNVVQQTLVPPLLVVVLALAGWWGLRRTRWARVPAWAGAAVLGAPALVALGLAAYDLFGACTSMWSLVVWTPVLSLVVAGLVLVAGRSGTPRALS